MQFLSIFIISTFIFSYNAFSSDDENFSDNQKGQKQLPSFLQYESPEEEEDQFDFEESQYPSSSNEYLYDFEDDDEREKDIEQKSDDKNNNDFLKKLNKTFNNVDNQKENDLNNNFYNTFNCRDNSKNKPEILCFAKENDNIENLKKGIIFLNKNNFKGFYETKNIFGIDFYIIFQKQNSKKIGNDLKEIL